MKLNDSKKFFTVLIPGVAALIAVLKTLPQNDPLPEGPHKETFIRHCTSCHGASPVLNKAPLMRNQWKAIILWMQKIEGMAPPSESDKSMLLDYLSSLKGKKMMLINEYLIDDKRLSQK